MIRYLYCSCLSFEQSFVGSYPDEVVRELSQEFELFAQNCHILIAHLTDRLRTNSEDRGMTSWV